MNTFIIIAIFNLLWFLPSTTIFILIHNYIQKKAPAWQSILDLLLLDGLKVMILHNILVANMIYCGIFYGQLNVIVAQIYLAIISSFSMMVITMQELILVIKALIIFKPGFLADQPDGKVIGLFRRISVLATGIRFALDFYLSWNRPCCSLTLEFLTGTEMVLRFAPGPTFYSMLTLLILTFLFIKATAPKVPANHQDYNFWKGLVGMTISWIFAFVAYGAFMHNGKHRKIEELLLSHIMANTFCNFLVPLYYVCSTPRLYQYVKGCFIKPTENQVEPNLPTVNFHNATNTVQIQHI